jgi:hypothetical protein
MKKSNRNLFIGAFAVIGVGAYLVYKFATKQKTRANEMVVSGEQSQPQTPVTKTTEAIKKVVGAILPVSSYPLKNGSKGSNVQMLQNWLNNNGYANPKLLADGIFGAKTESAVRNMQEFPNQKAIADFISNSAFSTNFAYGQVSLEFFTKFVK